jgi:hypothetical protein
LVVTGRTSIASFSHTPALSKIQDNRDGLLSTPSSIAPCSRTTTIPAFISGEAAMTIGYA